MNRFIFCAIAILMSRTAVAQTQLEINKAEHQKYQAADKELNKVYQQILKEYKGDTSFIHAFKR